MSVKKKWMYCRNYMDRIDWVYIYPDGDYDVYQCTCGCESTMSVLVRKGQGVKTR